MLASSIRGLGLRAMPRVVSSLGMTRMSSGFVGMSVPAAAFSSGAARNNEFEIKVNGKGGMVFKANHNEALNREQSRALYKACRKLEARGIATEIGTKIESNSRHSTTVSCNIPKRWYHHLPGGGGSIYDRFLKLVAKVSIIIVLIYVLYHIAYALIHMAFFILLAVGALYLLRGRLFSGWNWTNTSSLENLGAFKAVQNTKLGQYINPLSAMSFMANASKWLVQQSEKLGQNGKMIATSTVKRFEPSFSTYLGKDIKVLYVNNYSAEMRGASKGGEEHLVSMEAVLQGSKQQGSLFIQLKSNAAVTEHNIFDTLNTNFGKLELVCSDGQIIHIDPTLFGESNRIIDMEERKKKHH